MPDVGPPETNAAHRPETCLGESRVRFTSWLPPDRDAAYCEGALECEKLRGEGSRNSLIRLLTFASSVDYIANTERHVSELVRACAKSPRGLEELLELLLPCADTGPLDWSPFLRQTVNLRLIFH
jgi:hypothetical protein